jgi:predicted MFS family arabinose efflux permease
LVWLFAGSFNFFLIARVIAGLSEGNVQLSIAIISDVTTPEKRSRSLVKTYFVQHHFGSNVI